MVELNFVVCYNAISEKFFPVDATHLVEEKYRMNYYRLSLRLNFFEGQVDLQQADDMRRLCFRKITNLMTRRMMFQNHDSFYVIKYEIRLLARLTNGLIQHIDDEKVDETSDGESVSSDSEDDYMSEDSAYDSENESSSSDDECFSEEMSY